jgi:glycine betaine/choline ABC-type transport system substrate-binding protein
LVVAKARESLAVSKRAAQKIDTERFNVKKLNEGDVKEQYQVIIRKKFAALENLEDSGDINRDGIILERTSKFRPKKV